MTIPSLDALPLALSGHVGYLMVRLGKRAQRLFSIQIEPLGLRPPHCDILFTLQERGALSQVEIANTLAIERAHLVALLDQLTTMGLLARSVDPTDRRRHAVNLTPEGLVLTTRLAKIALEVEDTLLAELDQADRESLRALLRQLAVSP